MSATYQLHQSGDCWPPTCPVCAQEPGCYEARLDRGAEIAEDKP